MSITPYLLSFFIYSGKQWGKFRHAVNPVLMKPKNARLYIDPMQKVNSEFIQR